MRGRPVATSGMVPPPPQEDAIPSFLPSLPPLPSPPPPPQAKWAVYRAWCARHGHQVSRPTVPKVASFLLYLRRSPSCPTPPLLLTVLCLVSSFVSCFLSFLLILFFGTFSAPSVWSVLSPLLMSLLGIFLLSSRYCGVLPLSLSLLALCAILPARFSSCFL